MKTDNVNAKFFGGKPQKHAAERAHKEIPAEVWMENSMWSANLSPNSNRSNIIMNTTKGKKVAGQRDRNIYNNATEHHTRGTSTQVQTTASASRTSRSGTPSRFRPSTEYTPTYHDRDNTTRTQQRTLVSESTSGGSGSSSSASSTTSVDAEDDEDFEDNWEDSIMRVFNDMAGNLKKIGGGIRCNQNDSDPTEVQLKLNLPVPPMQYVDDMDIATKERFNTAMFTISPKRCNMHYVNYNHSDDEERLMETTMTTTDHYHFQRDETNTIPTAYKSLFHNQSDSTSNDDDQEKAQGRMKGKTYDTCKDPQSLKRLPSIHHRRDHHHQQQQQQVRKSYARNIAHHTGEERMDTVCRVPSHIIISNELSGISSNNSWKILSPRERPNDSLKKTTSAARAKTIISTINNNLDVAMGSSSKTVKDRQIKNSIRRHTHRNSEYDGKKNINDKRNPANANDRIQCNESSYISGMAKESDAVVVPKEVKAKRDKRKKSKSQAEIPAVIDCVHKLENGQHISECYSDLTTDFRKFARVEDAKIVPTIKTNFSEEELMVVSKVSSIQRKSMNTSVPFDPKSNDQMKIVQPSSLNTFSPKSGHVIGSSGNNTEQDKIKSIQLFDHHHTNVRKDPMMIVDGEDEIMGKTTDLNSPLKKRQEAPEETLTNEGNLSALDSSVPSDELEESSKNAAKIFFNGSPKNNVIKMKVSRDKVVNNKYSGQKSSQNQNNVQSSSHHSDDIDDQSKNVGENQSLPKKHNNKRMNEVKTSEHNKMSNEMTKPDDTGPKTSLEDENKIVGQGNRVELRKNIDEESKQILKEEEERKNEPETKKLNIIPNEATMQRNIKLEGEEAVERLTHNNLGNFVGDVVDIAKSDTKLELVPGIYKNENSLTTFKNKASGLSVNEERNNNNLGSNNSLSEFSRKSNDHSFLYEMQGFDDYCKNLSKNQVGIEHNNKLLVRKLRTSIDTVHSSNIRKTEEESTHFAMEDLDAQDENSYDDDEDDDERPDHYETPHSRDELLSEDSERYDNIERKDGREDSGVYTNSSLKEAYATDFLRLNSSTKDSRRKQSYFQSDRGMPHYPNFSSEATINTSYTQSGSMTTVDDTLHSLLTRGTTLDSAASISARSRLSSLQKSYASDLSRSSQILKQTYATDMPSAVTSTMSSLQTFDQDSTVYSGRRNPAGYESTDESIISLRNLSSDNTITTVNNSVLIHATTLLRTPKSNTKHKEELRLSVLSWIISLVQRALFSILLFCFAWIKHLLMKIRRKATSKVGYASTIFALNPDDTLRREEIQEPDRGSMIHQSRGLQQHQQTTTIIKRSAPRTNFMTDDVDEVGTCVESIVPDAHFPNELNGKFSKWKIVPAPTAPTTASSLSSPSSTSFGVLKKAYSAFSFGKKNEHEETNWLNQANTVDDEIASYYD